MGQSYEQVVIETARLAKAAAWPTEETEVPVETVAPHHNPGTDNVWKPAAG
jgi:hypothetical protein